MAGKGLNKVMLIGNLGRDPEVKYLPSGLAVANFTMATNDSYQDKEGNRQDRTEWHRIVLFGKLAEIAGQYLNKGGRIYLEGRIQTKEWDDKEGRKRKTTEIVGNNMIMLGGRGEMSGDSTSAEAPQQPAGDDDVPF